MSEGLPVPLPSNDPEVVDGLFIVLPPRSRELLDEMARRANITPEEQAVQLITENLYVVDYSPEMPLTELLARLSSR